MADKNKEDKQAYKYAQIKTDLSIQILEGQLRPHDRIPSLNEITAKYRVSKITARRVLNDLVTERLVYAIRGRGSFVADNTMRETTRNHAAAPNRKQLGVVFEHASGLFMSDIIKGIDEEAFNHGVHINLCLSNDSYAREAENLERLAEMGIDQILLFMVLSNEAGAVNVNAPLYLKLLEQNVRLLLLACHLPGMPIPSIVYDDYNGYRRLVEFMAERKLRRLAYVTRANNASTTADRLRGFKDGLLEHGLPYDAQAIIDVKISNNNAIVSDSRRDFEAFLKNDPGVDGIVCSDEMIAAGVFEALEKQGGTHAGQVLVGGMGSSRNLHVLKGNPYLLLEGDTHRLGREAAAIILRGELERLPNGQMQAFKRVLPLPLRVPKSLKG